MHRCLPLLLFAVCGCSTLDAHVSPKGGSEDSLLTAIRRPPPQQADIAPSVTNSPSQPRPAPQAHSASTEQRLAPAAAPPWRDWWSAMSQDRT